MVRRIQPGMPARGTRSGRPIMVLLDLLGRRWVLRLLWELREGPRRFRDLEASSGASPTIVNGRLAELRAAKLVELDQSSGYRLTPLGAELLKLLLPLHLWSEKWAKAFPDRGLPKRRQSLSNPRPG